MIEEQFLEELNMFPWDYANQYNDPNDSWQTWKSFFLETLDRHAPIQNKRTKTKAIPWINTSIKQLMRERDLHHKLAKKFCSEAHWKKFKTIRNKVKTEIRNAKAIYLFQ